MHYTLCHVSQSENKYCISTKECVDMMSAHSGIYQSHELFDLKVSGVVCYCEPCNHKLFYILCDLLLSPDIADSFATSTDFQYHLQYHSACAIMCYMRTVSWCLTRVSCRARQWDACVQAGEGEAGLHHASEHTLLCQGYLA